MLLGKVFSWMLRSHPLFPLHPATTNHKCNLGQLILHGKQRNDKNKQAMQLKLNEETQQLSYDGVHLCPKSLGPRGPFF